MSFDALAWAAKQNTGSSATKLVLLGLAECASRPDALAFPSLAALVEFSSLDRKTVVSALDRLEAAGYISDTGRKAGRSMRIKVYQLRLETVPKSEPSQKRDHPKNGAEIVPKTELGISKGTSTSRAKALSVAREMPEGWCVPTDWKQDMRREMGWSLADVDLEAQRFVDSAAAHGRKYKDWKAAWRSWCRSPFCKTKAPQDARRE
jgi:hypothetical protein